eukprot:2958709-Amphidinium_carterae.1
MSLTYTLLRVAQVPRALTGRETGSANPKLYFLIVQLLLVYGNGMPAEQNREHVFPGSTPLPCARAHSSLMNSHDQTHQVISPRTRTWGRLSLSTFPWQRPQ